MSKPTDELGDKEDLERIAACATDLMAAIRASNQPPEKIESFLALARPLAELSGLDDAHVALLHLTDRKLRDYAKRAEWTRQDGHATNLLNTLRITIKDVLEERPVPDVIESLDTGKDLSVPRAVLDGYGDVLAERADRLFNEAEQIRVQNFSFISMPINITLQNSTLLKNELKGEWVDLGVIERLIESIHETANKISVLIGGATRATRAAVAAALKPLLHAMDRAWRSGGHLMRHVGRKLKDLGKSAEPEHPYFQPFRDHPQAPEMVMIPAGEFVMGSPLEEEGRLDNEGPQHTVRLSRDFAIGKYPVTVDEYVAFCDATGADQLETFVGDRLNTPVVGVSADDAKRYCRWLSELTGHVYRLPTEAEWEYCCRAGTTGPAYHDSSNAGKLADLAWFGGEGGGGPKQVGVNMPNTWGLHDMLGNVWEWCADGMREYETGTSIDPVGPRGSPSQVARGGSWGDFAFRVRAAARATGDRDARLNDLGFRCVRDRR